MRKLSEILILFIAILLLVYSCDKDESTSLYIENYPMTIGTEWIYDFQQIVTKYETEISEEVIGVNTMNSTMTVRIEKDTTFYDTITVKIFKSYIGDYISTTYKDYKYMDNEGLKTYADSNPSSEIDIYIKEKPTLDFEFPLKEDSYWTYRQYIDFNNCQIDKEVIGSEILSLSGKDYNCHKVKMIFINDMSNNSVEITEWISEKGLIKKLTVYDRAHFPVEDEPYYGTLVETLTLKEVKLK